MLTLSYGLYKEEIDALAQICLAMSIYNRDGVA